MPHEPAHGAAQRLPLAMACLRSVWTSAHGQGCRDQRLPALVASVHGFMCAGCAPALDLRTVARFACWPTGYMADVMTEPDYGLQVTALLVAAAVNCCADDPQPVLSALAWDELAADVLSPGVGYPVWDCDGGNAFGPATDESAIEGRSTPRTPVKLNDKRRRRPATS